MNEPTLTYNAAEKLAVITFADGHELKVRGFESEEKAQDFFKKNAAKFAERGCTFTTSGAYLTR